MPNTRWHQLVREPRGQRSDRHSSHWGWWGGQSSFRRFFLRIVRLECFFVFAAELLLLHSTKMLLLLLFAFLCSFFFCFSRNRLVKYFVCPLTDCRVRIICFREKKSKKQSAAPIRLAFFLFIYYHNSLIVILHRGRKTTALTDCYSLFFPAGIRMRRHVPLAALTAAISGGAISRFLLQTY